MLNKNGELVDALSRIFRALDQASSPADPAVAQAKRALLNGLAEARMVDALDDASILAALTALPPNIQPALRNDHRYNPPR